MDIGDFLYLNLMLSFLYNLRDIKQYPYRLKTYHLKFQQRREYFVYSKSEEIQIVLSINLQVSSQISFYFGAPRNVQSMTVYIGSNN